ncbi:MAG: hypothetical protein COA71_12910 [SAR86 cluster bacterium]|uniref:Beta-lactamase-related domain-containing protein n=1 Tax=SAR86 cluster bacterium TaxID=2030880 RepID=A0A2A5C8I1_9GAMM|nr:MAG: hypothetical protein COA71_12910 [SAR86 cluster bacterium]
MNSFYSFAITLLTLTLVSSPLLAQSLPTSRPDRVGMSTDRLTRVNDAAQAQIDAGTISGAVVLVAKDGRVVLHEAYGTTPDGSRALNKDTIYWMASMTKPIVAAAILMEMEKGNLSLTDPASKFIPEWASSQRMVREFPGGQRPGRGGPVNFELVSAEREITVLDLVTHSAGLQVIGVPNDSIPPIEQGATIESWVSQLGDVQLEFQPGKDWGYSNAASFDVLVRIVEVASGIDFNTYLQTNIFAPLNMNNSGFYAQLEDTKKDLLGAVNPNLLQNPCIYGETFYCGSAGLWISTADYWRFAQMLANEGEFDGTRLLAPSSVAWMSTDHLKGLFPSTHVGPGTSGAGMGLGVAVVDNPIALQRMVPEGAYGWDGVGQRRFWVWPQQNVVLIMFVDGNAHPAHQAIETAVMQAIIE